MFEQDNQELNPMSEQVVFKAGTVLDQPDGKWKCKQDITTRIWTELQSTQFNMPSFEKYFERVR